MSEQDQVLAYMDIAQAVSERLAKVTSQRDELMAALTESVCIIDSLCDYVCEGSSIRLVGATDAVREAVGFMDGKARAAIAKVREG